MKVIKKRGSTAKPSKVVAKFKPSEKRIAKNLVSLQMMRKDKEIVDRRLQGESFEQIADSLGMEVGSVFEVVQKNVERWANSMRLAGKQEREMDLSRYDALLAILWKQIEPKVAVDAKGNPIYDEVTGQPVMNGGDKVAIKLYMDILERRAKLLGLESSTKLVTDDSGELVRREYVGVDLGDL